MSVGITTDLNTLRAAILSDTDKENDGAVTTVQLDAWIQEAVRELWTRMVPVGRDNFTQTMLMSVGAADVTFTAPNLFVLKPLGNVSVQAKILGVRGVDVDICGQNYRPIRPYRFRSRGYVGRLSYRVRGTALGADTAGDVGTITIEILPKEFATLYPFRVWYLQAPELSALAANPITLPFGGDTYVTQMACVHCRLRFEEDPTQHLALAERSWLQVRDWLTGGMQGPAATPDDWTDDDNEGYW